MFGNYGPPSAHTSTLCCSCQLLLCLFMWVFCAHGCLTSHHVTSCSVFSWALTVWLDLITPCSGSIGKNSTWPQPVSFMFISLKTTLWSSLWGCGHWGWQRASVESAADSGCKCVDREAPDAIFDILFCSLAFLEISCTSFAHIFNIYLGCQEKL